MSVQIVINGPIFIIGVPFFSSICQPGCGPSGVGGGVGESGNEVWPTLGWTENFDIWGQKWSPSRVLGFLGLLRSFRGFLRKMQPSLALNFLPVFGYQQPPAVFGLAAKRTNLSWIPNPSGGGGLQPAPSSGTWTPEVQKKFPALPPCWGLAVAPAAVRSRCGPCTLCTTRQRGGGNVYSVNVIAAKHWSRKFWTPPGKELEGSWRSLACRISVGGETGPAEDWSLLWWQ